MAKTKKKATSKRRRPSIGEDPLDALVPGKRATKASRRGLEPATAKPAPKLEPKAGEPPKVRATFHLPEDLFEECRDAVVHLSGPPVRLTLAYLAETALRKELDRLKKKHNREKDFPKRESGLKGGRPIGS